jgi:hypothetical protein
VHRQDEDRQAGPLHLQVSSRLDPIHPGHGEIHQHHVRPSVGDHAEGLRAVRRLLDLDGPLAVGQEPPERRAKSLIVVHQQDAHRRVLQALSGGLRLM